MISGIARAFATLESLLAGAPDIVLTVALLVVASAGMLIAIKGPATLKAATLLYFLFP